MPTYFRSSPLCRLTPSCLWIHKLARSSESWLNITRLGSRPVLLSFWTSGRKWYPTKLLLRGGKNSWVSIASGWWLLEIKACPILSNASFNRIRNYDPALKSKCSILIIKLATSLKVHRSMVCIAAGGLPSEDTTVASGKSSQTTVGQPAAKRQKLASGASTPASPNQPVPQKTASKPLKIPQTQDASRWAAWLGYVSSQSFSDPPGASTRLRLCPVGSALRSRWYFLDRCKNLIRSVVSESKEQLLLQVKTAEAIQYLTAAGTRFASSLVKL